jgi:hypothetical protein
MRFSPETFNIVECHEPAPSDEILNTGDAVCLKNADGVWIIVHEDYAVDANQLVITIGLGTTEALAEAHGTTLASDFPAWACLDAATSDALVRQTDAATYTLDPEGIARQIWVFYVSAASIAANSYDWVHAGFTGGNDGNIASVLYILDRPRYQQETPPSAI